jgi:FkbH-like protein
VKYTEILERNRALASQMQGKEYRAALISNVMVRQLVDVLEYTLRSRGVAARVETGEYDQIVSESRTYRDRDLCVVIWELGNLVDGFHYRAPVLPAEQLEAILSKTENEMLFVFENLRDTALVVMQRFSALAFTHADTRVATMDAAARRLNEFADRHAPANFVFLDPDKIIAELSIQKSFDYRYFLSSKVLHTIDFWKECSERVAPSVLSVLGKSKKALIFDCDNTLWRGIVGEDGVSGIEMTRDTPAGAAYAEVQHIARELASRGVILGICSKNNPADVDEVLRSHPGMVIADEIVIRRVNWDDKVTNLRSIASSLNIGLDSLVFVDDSDFEAGLIREQLPEVTVVPVPKRIDEYPAVMRATARLFATGSTTAEDAERTKMYVQQVERDRDRASFADLEEYLRSLGLALTVHINDLDLAPRVAQLTQKTNQFNLTTRRYTENEIRRMMERPDFEVFAFDVRDKYGEYGVTGVCIARVDSSAHSAELDTLLMSCRVLGRNLERVFFDSIVARLREAGVTAVEASFIPTAKNPQVADLYDKLGFELLETKDGVRRYRRQVNAFQPSGIDYISVETTWTTASNE